MPIVYIAFLRQIPTDLYTNSAIYRLGVMRDVGIECEEAADEGRVCRDSEKRYGKGVKSSDC